MQKKGTNFIGKITIGILFVMQMVIPLTSQCVEKVENSELTFLIKSHDLYVEDEEILVNVGGVSYLVTSLEKRGNHWLAKSSAGNCPWGHPLCGYCFMCHHVICPLYQTRCSASK